MKILPRRFSGGIDFLLRRMGRSASFVLRAIPHCWLRDSPPAWVGLGAVARAMVGSFACRRLVGHFVACHGLARVPEAARFVSSICGCVARFRGGFPLAHLVFFASGLLDFAPWHGSLGLGNCVAWFLGAGCALALRRRTATCTGVPVFNTCPRSQVR